MKFYRLVYAMVSISVVAVFAHGNNLDFSLSQRLPTERQIFFGWDFIPWEEWLRNHPSSGPLKMPYSGTTQLHAFEARGAALVAKPVTFFTKEYLQNIATVRMLDPMDSHEQIPDPAYFAVRTQVPFPSTWSHLVIAGKLTSLLDAKRTDYLELISYFKYFSGDEITSSEEQKNRVRLLDILGGSQLTYPQVISVQGIVKINQIAQFGTIITFFYGVDPGHTLVVNYFALALKEKDLDLGIDAGGVHLNGRSILLGDSPANTPQEPGIGQGLPKFASERFSEMIDGFRK